jgi:hypothetical protein
LDQLLDTIVYLEDDLEEPKYYTVRSEENKTCPNGFSTNSIRKHKHKQQAHQQHHLDFEGGRSTTIEQQFSPTKGRDWSQQYQKEYAKG